MDSATNRFGQLTHKAHDLADKVGSAMVEGFHILALFAIGATIVWAAVFAFLDMAARGHAGIEDILLLFEPIRCMAIKALPGVAAVHEV